MTNDEIAALPPVLRVADVAKLLEVSPDTVYAGVANGTIPVLRVGRAFRFNRDVILRDVLGYTDDALRQIATHALVGSLRAKVAEFSEELRAAREGAREALDEQDAEGAKLTDSLKASFASLRDVGRAAFDGLDPSVKMSAREALIEDLNASHAKLRDIARRYGVDWQPPADA